jgi:aminodeoxyfutalosine deaminase
VSNVRTGAVASLEEHPLRELAALGVRCSVNTDDPAMFDTDLTREHDAAGLLGLDGLSAYENGVAGALCDEATRERLRTTGEAFAWGSVP